ncbi:MAG: hypothetical protein FWF09_01855, partial [Bacteroidales bacterium]|nr:hypothetical protein [Bacteroidales bacterium]
TQISNIMQIVTGGFIMAMTLGIQAYAYFHLPLIDILPWKVGTKTVIEERLPVQHFLTYKNGQTGETKEFLFDEISSQLVDSTWNATWSYVSRYDIDPNKKPHNLRIINSDGDDVTESYLDVETPTYIVTSYNIETWRGGALPKLNQLYQQAIDREYNFIMIVDEDPQKVQLFIDEYNIEFPVYTGDGTELKMMNRSNPGVTLIENRTVKQKWSVLNIPETVRP